MHTQPREFQGHHEMRLDGRWRDSTHAVPGRDAHGRAGDQLQAVAAFYMLDPESDDGLVTWNLFDSELAPGKIFPVWRVTELPGAVH